MKNSYIIRNYIAELIYNIILVIMPLAITPYISRVLGAEQIGAYSYVQSITIYFNSFATLGTSIYAQREIAMFSSDLEQKYQIAVDIIKLRILLGTVSALLLTFFSLIYVHYQILLLIQVIYIIAGIFDVTWYYYGIEQFTKVVYVFTISKILSFFLTFLFVKRKEDILIYAVIFALCELGSQIILSVPLIKVFYLNYKKRWIVFSRIKSIVLLFLPQIANQIYAGIDKTMIVLLSGSEAENGYYEQATKIVAILRIFMVDALSFVMMPRISKLYGEGKEKQIKNEIDLSIGYLCFIMWPLVFGISGLSKQMIPWFLGDSFLKSEKMLNILAFNIIPVGVYTILGNQLLVPINMHTEYVKSIAIGVLVNILLNSVLIRKWEGIGACYASLISNIIIALYQLYYARNYVSLLKNIWQSRKSILATVIMYNILSFFSNRISSSFCHTFLLIIISVVIYIGVIILLRDEIFIRMYKLGKDYICEKIMHRK